MGPHHDSGHSPDYIDRGAEQVLRAPFLHEGVRLRAFAFHGSVDHHQQIAARYLNGALGEPAYTAAEPIVLLTFAEMPRIASLDERDAKVGYAAEVDVAFWVPLRREGRLVWFNPYIIVDNPYAAAIGREHYGFPKLIGPIGFPVDAGDPHTVDAMVLSEASPRTRAQVGRLLELRETEARAETGGGLLAGLAALSLGLSQARRGGDVRIVFLRQLRDVEHPSRAAHQEVLEAPARLLRLAGVSTLQARYELRLPHHDSHPIARELGLRETGNLCLGAWELGFDFVMERGKKVSATPRPKIPTRRRRVAILGGGPAGLAAAESLTRTPELRDRFDVTVYQKGWRLGGKTASGHDDAHAQRIEEHGLHVWFGFYERAFGLVRRVYGELARDPRSPMPTWRDAFEPQHEVLFHEQLPSGLRPWLLRFAPNGATPGEDESAARRWLRRARSGLLAGAQLLELPPAAVGRAVLRTLGRARGPSAEDDEDTRRASILLGLFRAISTGLVRDDLWRRGMDSIDDEELRAWLRRHGASEEVLDSPLIRSVYDLVLAFRDGRVDQPDLAAGTALSGLLRMLFDYRGAVMWRMTASMGDAVIAPLYEVLERRGVRFAFFHRAVDVAPSADGRRVERITMARQARTRSGAPYEPLFECRGLPSWPSRPHFEQLEDGEALRASGIDLEHDEGLEIDRFSLREGEDFDLVILATPVAALPGLCPKLMSLRPEWRDMVAHVRTCATLGVQLWSGPSTEDLGWARQGSEPPIASGLPLPLATWADMTQVARWEMWPEGERPGHIAYFCGPLEDPSAEAAESAAHAHVEDLLTKHLPALWPSFTPSALLRGGLYTRVNAAPSERYVQSVTGSTRYRLKPGQSGFSNLVFAGDWTRTSVNAGCVEAAVQSGEEAAEVAVAALSALQSRSRRAEASAASTGGAGAPSFVAGGVWERGILALTMFEGHRVVPPRPAYAIDA